MSHTPGPWIVTSDTDGYLQIHPTAEPAFCVGIAPSNIGMPMAEVLANARLQAAAPDLLEAIERLLKFNQELCEDVGVSTNYPSAEMARKAIAKATDGAKEDD